MDIDTDSDEDIEAQMRDLEQLNAILEADEDGPFDSNASASSIRALSASTKVSEYSKIETALALNKLTDDKLNRLENILLGRLKECRQKLTALQNSDSMDRREKVDSFRYINCGKPYFKDSRGFSAPDNEDTIIMRKSEMYDFSCVASVPGWTVKDKSEFITLLHQMSKEIKSKQLYSKMAQLKREVKFNKANKTREIAAVKAEISSLCKKTLKDLALPINEEYDWDAVANKLKCRHSAQEYSALWTLFLHPSINKNCWTKTEHTNLQKVAESNHLQDWDLIAQELNTQRTGYQCFVYFRTNMGNTFSNQKWTKEEEEYLKRIIEYYREDDYIPWGRVAAAMENRTKIQIYNKYLRLIEIRKGRFLREEDSVILNCVEKYGTDFKKIQSFLPGRSAIQLRNRHNVLIKTRLSKVWTVAEDKTLIQMMANQDSSINYASISKHFPGKDRINVRARYLTLMKWMQRNPQVDITHAPRRGARRLGHGEAAIDLNKAVEKLKHRMQTEVEHKKSKRLSRLSSHEELDEAIVAFMVTEIIKESDKQPPPDENDICIPPNNKSTSIPGDLNVTNLRKILILLKAKLNKTTFEESPYYNDYPELLTTDKEVCLVKVKSYSKKDVNNTISVEKQPDIWGKTLLGPSEYVLPPNLSTIIGCRTLMAHAGSKHGTLMDINYLKRKNVIFKEELFRLMERFNILFLWPMLLSNEGPNQNKSADAVGSSPISILRLSKQTALRKSLLFEDSDDSDDDDNDDVEDGD